jgi:hypothetical protein
LKTANELRRGDPSRRARGPSATAVAACSGEKCASAGSEHVLEARDHVVRERPTMLGAPSRHWNLRTDPSNLNGVSDACKAGARIAWFGSALPVVPASGSLERGVVRGGSRCAFPGSSRGRRRQA